MLENKASGRRGGVGSGGHENGLEWNGRSGWGVLGEVGHGEHGSGMDRQEWCGRHRRVADWSGVEGTG